MKSIYRNREGYKDPTGGVAAVSADREAKKIKGANKLENEKRMLYRIIINTVRYAAGVSALPRNEKHKRRMSFRMTTVSCHE